MYNNNNYNSYGYGNYGYNNYYNPAPQNNSQVQQNFTYTPLTFVNGIEGAKGFILPAPNTTVYLRDSDSDKLSSDPQGRLTLRTYRLVEVNENEPKQPTQDLSSFATKDDLKAMQERIDKIQSMLEKKKEGE